MEEKDFENTVYDFEIKFKVSDELKGNPDIEAANDFLAPTEYHQYVFQKSPNGVERYKVGLVFGEIPFKWLVYGNWLIVIQLSDGSIVTQSFSTGIGIHELTTTDESFQFMLTKAK